MNHYNRFIRILFLVSVFAVTTAGQSPPESGSRVLYGIDVLKKLDFEPLEWKRTAVFCNQSSVNHQNLHTLDILNATKKNRIPLIYLFKAPEWTDLEGTDEFIFHDTVRVRRLNYPLLRFKTLDLLSCDAILFDMQLSGTTDDPAVPVLQIAAFLAKNYDLELIVCDRPPLSRADTCQGPWHPGFELPYQYGLTSGELAAYFGRYFFPGLRLTIIPMKHWQRHQTAADNSHYPVVVDTLIDHPARGKHLLSLNLLRATNLHIKTDDKALWLGSPSADPFFLKAKLSDIHPAFGAIHIRTIQSDTLTFQMLTLDPVPLPEFYKITACLRLMLILYPQQITLQTGELSRRTGSPDYGEMLLEHRPLDHFNVYWEPGYRTFYERRENVLIYPQNDHKMGSTRE